MPRLRDSHDWPAGTVERWRCQSQVLQANPWDDPSERELAVYLPSGYSVDRPPYPSLWDLAAFTNSGPGHLNWRNQGENLPQRLDRLIGSGAMPPTVVVIPDCYTSLGGNQYVNSPSVGRYADYLVEELVPLVGDRLNVVADAAGRGIFGKSSGGYGALYHAMHYPEVWGAAAVHAGDVGFDVLFRPGFPDAAGVLAEFDGDVQKFIRAFWAHKRPPGRWFHTLMMLAMAASYDPDPADPANIRLPFDLQTCELIEQRWQNWLAFDPLGLVETHATALKGLRGLYIDVGSFDQYHIQFGSRALVRKLQALGIEHHFEEFRGSHSGIDWRLDYSLPFLAKCLKNSPQDASLEP